MYWHFGSPVSVCVAARHRHDRECGGAAPPQFKAESIVTVNHRHKRLQLLYDDGPPAHLTELRGVAVHHRHSGPYVVTCQCSIATTGMDRGAPGAGGTGQEPEESFFATKGECRTAFCTLVARYVLQESPTELMWCRKCAKRMSANGASVVCLPPPARAKASNIQPPSAAEVAEYTYATSPLPDHCCTRWHGDMVHGLCVALLAWNLTRHKAIVP